MTACNTGKSALPTRLTQGMREASMTARSVRQYGYAEMLEEGAAEIERLRTALQEIADYVDSPGRPVLAIMAREALRGD